LDDSANRRIIIPEAFLSVDAILLLYKRIVKGLKVNENIIRKRMYDYLPFYAVENILMNAVKKGGDRQTLHKIIRDKAMYVIERVREGKSANLFEELKKDDVPDILKSNIVEDIRHYVGRSAEQVIEVSEKIKRYLGV